MWLMLIVPKKHHAKCEVNTTQDKGVTKLESWCPHFSWQSIMGPLLVIESTSGYRDYLLLSETPLVIGNTSSYWDYLLSSKVPLVIETTSCYRKHHFHFHYIFLFMLLLIPFLVIGFSIKAKAHIGNTSCYRDYLLSSETPLVIETTSCYWKHLLLSRLPVVIETTCCYRDYLLSSRLPLLTGSTSCYRDYLLLLRALLVIERHFCQTQSIIVHTVWSCDTVQAVAHGRAFTWGKMQVVTDWA